MRPAPAVARHRPRRLLVGVAAACAWIVLAAAPAAGHAVLEGGSVVDGQVLPEVPDEVRLQFNEPVTTPQGGIRVYDAAGGRVDAGDAGVAPDDPSAVRVGLGGDVGDGTYVVTYRITSADGHPVSGALVFSVGEEAGATDELVAQVFSSDADRPWAVAATLARWAMYAGVLLAAGIAATTWWLRREVGEDDAPVAAVLRWTAWLALAATVLDAAGVPTADLCHVGRLGPEEAAAKRLARARDIPRMPTAPAPISGPRSPSRVWVMRA